VRLLEEEQREELQGKKQPEVEQRVEEQQGVEQVLQKARVLGCSTQHLPAAKQGSEMGQIECLTARGRFDRSI